MNSGRVISKEEAEHVLDARATGIAKIIMAMRTQHGIMKNEIADLGDGFIDRLPAGLHAGVEHSFMLYKSDLRAFEAGIEIFTALLPHERAVRALLDASRMVSASNEAHATGGA